MNREELNSLKDTDIYSVALFALYKLVDVPEYATTSELPYVLDHKNMLKLCQYFGGTTIRVPTIEEFKSTMQLLLLYQYTKLDGIDYQEATKLIGYSSNQLRKVKSAYTKMCKILDKYKFNVRGLYGAENK